MNQRDWKTDEAERNVYEPYDSPNVRAELERRARGAGGTKGGIGEFLIGLAMAIGGGYLFMNQVHVSSSYWTLYGYNAFGLSLLPLLAGIGFLFFNGRSKLGWLLTFAGAVIITIGIIANLTVYWQSTSLFNTLMIFTLIAGGIGLIARALKEH
jgi:uncharacterized protein